MRGAWWGERAECRGEQQSGGSSGKCLVQGYCDRSAALPALGCVLGGGEGM